MPAYYGNRDTSGVPVRWVELMKNAIRTCTPQFSMMRMVKEYTNRFYLPAAITDEQYAGNRFAVAREMAQWKQQMRQRWGQVSVQAVMPVGLQLTVGESVKLGAKVWFNGLPDGDAAVEVVSWTLDHDGHLAAQQVTSLQHSGWDNGAAVYEGEFKPETSGQFAIGIRARPNRSTLINANELGIASWAGA